MVMVMVWYGYGYGDMNMVMAWHGMVWLWYGIWGNASAVARNFSHGESLRLEQEHNALKEGRAARLPWRRRWW